MVDPVAQSLFDFAVAAIVIAWVSLALRVYVRVCMLRFFGTDDYLMTAAVICLTIICAADIVVAQTGLGGANLSNTNRAEAYKYLFIHELVYLWAVCLARAAVCFFYLRVTPVQWQRWVVMGIMVVNIIISIASFFGQIFQCSPPSFYWTQYINPAGGSCNLTIMVNGLGPAQNCISIISDFALSLFPLLLLKDSSLNLRLKLIVIGLLSIGAVSGVASIIRYVMISKLGPTTPDSSTITSTVWTTVEPFAGILAANIACYRPLFRRVLESVTSSYNKSTGNPTIGRTTIRNTHRQTLPTQHAIPLDSKSDVNLVLDDLSPSRGREHDLESNAS